MTESSHANNHNFRLLLGTIFFSLLFLIPCILICTFVPVKKLPIAKTLPTFEVEAVALEADVAFEEEKAIEDNFDVSYNTKVQDSKKRLDEGLALYRQPYSKAAVEWFYIHLTEDRDVALAIMKEADANDIPLSLAFALAHTESEFKPKAMNKNKNGSIDRGLFQLNNKSFPNLTEQDFFNPDISAKYGMSHLRYCLDTAGNEIAALAMYNAGTGKVRNNATPQTTLNYVSKIDSYRKGIDILCTTDVLSFYETTHDVRLAFVQ